MTQVLDYSLARPAPADIKAKGYAGVMRYVAPLPADAAKVITLAEYNALRAAGLTVGLNWEWYSNRAREGASAGTADAQSALAQANALGYTGPIYFSVDYDATPEDQPALNAYFKACAAVIGLARLGCYGGFWPLSRLFDAGLVVFGWQTIAWSGTNLEHRAHLLQTGATDFNGGADINNVLKSDWAGTGGAPPVDYKTQQANDVWSANTGIHASWLQAWQQGIILGPPVGGEVHTVDWAGNPIIRQDFTQGWIEDNQGTHHGYTMIGKALVSLW